MNTDPLDRPDAQGVIGFMRRFSDEDLERLLFCAHDIRFGSGEQARPVSQPKPTRRAMPDGWRAIKGGQHAGTT